MSQFYINSGGGGGGSGAVKLIQTKIASNSSSISFNSGITSAYNTYQLIWNSVTTDQDGQSLKMLVSTDGGSTYISSGYISTLFSYNIGSPSSIFDANQILLTDTGFSVSTRYTTYSGNILLHNLTSGVGFATFDGFQSANDGPGQPGSDSGRGGLVSATAPQSSIINAIQLSMTAGNLLTGTFSLYGISQ